MKMPTKARITAFFLTLILVVGIIPITPILVAPNIDNASSWARDGITQAVAKGFVPSDLQSNYTNVINRQEFCRMAVKWLEYATGQPIDIILANRGLSRNPNAFTDTNDPDVLAAFALGITSGVGNNQFNPSGQFNREQAATMIMNTVRALGADVSNPPSSGFVDLSIASSWAIDGINYVRANGIMQGVGDNRFDPLSLYTREQSIITFNNIDFNALLGVIFRTVYRNNVNVVEQPPIYSFTTIDDRVIITVHNPTAAIMQLTTGNTFVFEPTDANPGGMSGHILSIDRSGSTVIITARIPQSLEEIFNELHIANEADLMALGGEIVVDDEYVNSGMIQVGRNPTSLYSIRFLEYKKHGVTLNGTLRVHQPVVNYNIAFSLVGGLDIRLLELVAGASINIDAKYEGAINEFLQVARVRVFIKGVLVELPMGVRVAANGQAEANFGASVEARIGIRNNNPFFTRIVNYEFGFEFTARLELMAELRLQVSVLGFLEVYGVYGNLGIGLETSTAILNRCLDARCFVVGTNVILRMGSVRNYGVTRILPSLNFGPIYFMPNIPTNFHYFTGGRWHGACPHRIAAADVYLPLLGVWEGTSTGGESSFFGTSITAHPRASTMIIYHDGFGYRAMIHNFPIEGSTLSRVGYHSNLTFDPQTGVFESRGFQITYNPEGRNWSFGVARGELRNGVLAGNVFWPNDNHRLGPFSYTQVSGIDEDNITGGPASGFVVSPAGQQAVREAAERQWSISASPLEPDFGTHTLGYANRPTQTITIRNIGTQPITLNALPNIPNWTLTPSSNWTTAMTANQTRTFTIRPNHGLAAGAYNPTIIITGSNNTSAQIRPTFTVGAGQWEISATPSNPDFGTHTLGYANRPTQTITIRNTGNQSITLNPLPSVPNWTLAPASGWGNQLAPNQTRTFTIRPNHGLVAGTYSPVITITGSNNVNVQVRPTFTVGEGQWSISTSPEILDFGIHTFGYAQRPTQTVTIRNTGNQPITLNALPVVPNWTLVPASNWTNVITPNQTRTFTIRPNHGLDAGTYSPVIIITANNGAIAIVRPTFTVGAGQWSISATPNMPDFGSHNVGYANRPTQTITIRNTGNQSITLNSLPNILNWTLAPGSNWTGAIAPNQTRTFTIRPNHGLSAGVYNTIITITGSNGVSVQIHPMFTVIAIPEP
jgi:hypothetical protein